MWPLRQITIWLLFTLSFSLHSSPFVSLRALLPNTGNLHRCSLCLKTVFFFFLLPLDISYHFLREPFPDPLDYVRFSCHIILIALWILLQHSTHLQLWVYMRLLHTVLCLHHWISSLAQYLAHPKHSITVLNKWILCLSHVTHKSPSLLPVSNTIQILLSRIRIFLCSGLTLHVHTTFHTTPQSPDGLG